MPTRGAVMAVVLSHLAADPGLAAQTPSVSLLDTAVLAARGFRETSGVAPSRRASGRYWSINDSGDGPFLYLTDSVGNDLGRVRVSGAGARDWEDLGSGPCGAGHCLYIADIGDNTARRGNIRVYWLPEPELTHGPADTLRAAPVTDSLLLRYPEGPRDAEAIAVTPDGWLFVITKARSGYPVLYRARIDGRGHARLLERRDALPIPVSLIRGRLVTGAAVSNDGTWLAVRTYVSLHLFRRAGDDLRPLVPAAGLVIPVVEAQGEAIAFEGTDRLILTSERGRRGYGLLTRLRLHGLGP